MGNEFKYVIEIPSYGDVYDYCYEELKGNNNVYMMKDYISFNSKILKKIHHYHLTKKIWLPFRSIWNNTYYNNPFDKNDNIIFVLPVPRNDIHKYGAIKKLRKKYPNCKIVLLLTDLVKKIVINRVCKENELESFFSSYDCIVSFDFEDCKKYNFIYNPLVYSAPTELENINEDIDVFFCGRVKDRLDLIMRTFYFLKNNAIKCVFILRDVPLNKRINEDGIIYLDDFMSYKDNLEYVKRSKCLLEIMQGGGSGYTLRTCEAVAYNKKLITNNYNDKDAEFYDERIISFFKNVEDIDLNFIKNKKVNFIDRFYFSPYKLIDKISKKLKREDT